jgi:hypothetical protein
MTELRSTIAPGAGAPPGSTTLPYTLVSGSSISTNARLFLGTGSLCRPGAEAGSSRTRHLSAGVPSSLVTQPATDAPRTNFRAASWEVPRESARSGLQAPRGLFLSPSRGTCPSAYRPAAAPRWPPAGRKVVRLAPGRSNWQQSSRGNPSSASTGNREEARPLRTPAASSEGPRECRTQNPGTRRTRRRPKAPPAASSGSHGPG